MLGCQQAKNSDTGPNKFLGLVHCLTWQGPDQYLGHLGHDEGLALFSKMGLLSPQRGECREPAESQQALLVLIRSHECRFFCAEDSFSFDFLQELLSGKARGRMFVSLPRS